MSLTTASSDESVSLPVNIWIVLVNHAHDASYELDERREVRKDGKNSCDSKLRVVETFT
jgi:hypothetical protein